MGDEEQSERRAALIAEFVAAGGAEHAAVAEQMVGFKCDYLDGDGEAWSPADVDEVLFELYPAKVVLDDEDIVATPAGAAAFLRFLATRAGGDRALFALADRVEASASRFVAAMHDEDRWSFGKRMWANAIGEGVDLSDQSAVARFMESFNARPLAERDQILGRMPSSVGAPFASFPPVVLLPPDELAILAGDALLVRRVVALAGFIGAGRPLTDRGNLKLADGKQLVGLLGTNDRVDEQIGDRTFKTRSSGDLTGVDYVFELAIGTRVIEAEGRRVKPGPNAGFLDDPLGLLYALLLVMLQQAGPTSHRYRNDNYGFGWYAADLDRCLPMMLLDMYRDREPLEFADLLAETWDELIADRDLENVSPEGLEMHRDSVDHSLRQAMDQLAGLGVVEIEGETVVPNSYIGSDRSGGTVTLTPLGLWAVQRMAARIGDAPIVGALRGETATGLLTGAGDLAADSARAEIDAWVAVRGASTAAAELCDAMRDAGETSRSLAFQALLRIGVDASDAVATLGDDPDLAELVSVFRVDTLTAAPNEMDRSGQPERWVRLLYAVIEQWGPVAAASVWAEQAAGPPGIGPMLDSAWRVKGDRTAVVLGAIGAHHSDKVISKAARKALFKHRSAS